MEDPYGERRIGDRLAAQNESRNLMNYNRASPERSRAEFAVASHL
jgi:hypothetical protein